MIRDLRTQVFWLTLLLFAALLPGGLLWPWLWWGLLLVTPLLLLGIYDLTQRRHNLLRNYPIVGHLRYLIEDTGAELRQYIVESNTEGRPFNRDERSLMYQRSKDVSDKKPFGTEVSVYAPGYAWLAHSMAPKHPAANPVEAFRVEVGGSQCTTPYSCSVLNISAMSFGSLSGAAVEAMNGGAARGGFAQVTGEGGISRYHRKPGGDLIWQIGTGYFGCRTSEGEFDADRFAEASRDDQVKMIELKLSQGAKPGHGGILPGVKVTAEISEARGVPIGTECISPPFHRAFDTPIGLLEFVARLRDLAGGKPVGFKLCIGRFDEFLGVCKAMVETEIRPDFITVDGSEGGTGAAPIEFSDHIGLPIREGIVFVHNALVGIGVRDQVCLVASGKLVTAFAMTAAMTLGANVCNTARGFMFAVGCIQAQSCHTNKCPVGVATQSRRLQRAINVPDKSERVHHFHHNTLEVLAEVIAAAGLEHPRDITPEYLFQRVSPTQIKSYAELYHFIEPNQLLDGRAGMLQPYWDVARSSSFAPKGPVAVIPPP